eukprot:4279178-Amphidinium_carterae.1
MAPAVELTAEKRIALVHLKDVVVCHDILSNVCTGLLSKVTVNPGELLYYPGYWWHHTLQLETPSIGYTGALVGTEARGSPRRGGKAGALKCTQQGP